jgi:hypothetical protein
MAKKKEKRIPYTKKITLEGLSIVKEEVIKVPLEELRITKKYSRS